MAFLEPDRYFSRLSHIDIERDILQCGFEHVLLDIDNTILTRDTHEVPRDIGFWLARARDAGIVFCLLSNNWHHGVYDLASRLDLPIVAKAVKPLPPAFLIALSKIDANRKNTLVIGDQLVTDVMGAHTLGMKAYLLAPLVEQDLPHTLLLRNFERVVMGGRQPEGAASAVGVMDAAGEVDTVVGADVAGKAGAQEASDESGASGAAPGLSGVPIALVKAESTGTSQVPGF